MAGKMKFSGDVLYSAGKYTKDGQEKTRYVKCGAYFTSDDGRVGIKLEFVPTAVDAEKGLWFGLFPEKTDKPAPSSHAPAAQKAPPPDDEVPF